jgi:hypothetical protein
VRPSHIWAVASEILGEVEFREFQQLMKSDSKIRQSIQRASHPVIERARAEALHSMKSCVEKVQNHFESSASLAPIEELAKKVIHGYK